MTLHTFFTHVSVDEGVFMGWGEEWEVVSTSVEVTIKNHLLVQWVLWLVPTIFSLLWGSAF